MNLVLAILGNVAVFAMFRAIPRMRAVTFHAIVVNYWVCVITGSLFSMGSPAWEEVSLSASWVPWAGVMAVIFITTFVLMAETTQRLSMTVATVASKMALAVPVLFSLLVLGVQAKDYDGWNYLGIALAFPAIAMSSWGGAQTQEHSNTSKWKRLALPFSVFILGGVIDALLNYVNLNHVSAALSPIFTIFVFMTTGTIGIIILIIRRQFPSKRSFLAGLILGVPNFFSIYFTLLALGDFNNDGALFFPLVNLGIILASAVVGTLAFREKLTRTKVIGLSLAVVAILFLAYQELQGLL